MNREWLWGIVLFARAVLFGTALGLYFEVFRALRLLFPHPAWLVAVEDLLFFLPASLAHVFFHYACGEGETRWFAVLGVVLGFLLYLASVGKIVQKVLRGVKRLLSEKVVLPIKEKLELRRAKRNEALERKKQDKNERKQTKRNAKRIRRKKHDKN